MRIWHRCSRAILSAAQNGKAANLPKANISRLLEKAQVSTHYQPLTAEPRYGKTVKLLKELEELEDIQANMVITDLPLRLCMATIGIAPLSGFKSLPSSKKRLINPIRLFKGYFVF